MAVSFVCDYNNGVHPEILEALIRTNEEVLPGYGADIYCDSAKAKIRDAIGCPKAEVFLLNGGTQTNALAISTTLRNYEGVIAANTGHVSLHEAGAIEYTGHKVLALPGVDGKLQAETVDRSIRDFYHDGAHEHMVFPGMVYISHPTEYGTLYSLAELTALSEVCRRNDIPLYLDGARLGYGLVSKETDVTLRDIARLTDMFYIGGTKVGAFCGEALVYPRGNAPAHFINLTKQRGALTAKGRLLGVQFDALFTNDLYYRAARNAIERAEELKAVLHEKNIPFFLESPTNQQFVILANDAMDRLGEKVGFDFWEKYDETHTVVRFATSWFTKKEDIAYLHSVL